VHRKLSTPSFPPPSPQRGADKFCKSFHPKVRRKLSTLSFPPSHREGQTIFARVSFQKCAENCLPSPFLPPRPREGQTNFPLRGLGCLAAHAGLSWAAQDLAGLALDASVDCAGLGMAGTWQTFFPFLLRPTPLAHLFFLLLLRPGLLHMLAAGSAHTFFSAFWWSGDAWVSVFAFSYFLRPFFPYSF